MTKISLSGQNKLCSLNVVALRSELLLQKWVFSTYRYNLEGSLCYCRLYRATSLLCQGLLIQHLLWIPLFTYPKGPVKWGSQSRLHGSCCSTFIGSKRCQLFARPEDI